jgi:hypothetical protein
MSKEREHDPRTRPEKSSEAKPERDRQQEIDHQENKETATNTRPGGFLYI